MLSQKKKAACATQNAKAKSAAVKTIVLAVRRAGLDYEGWREVCRRVRQACDLRPRRKGRKLPRVLDQAGFRRLYELIDREGTVLHGLLVRFFFYSGLRVSEVCRLEVADVDLETGEVRVRGGKGQKDRTTLLPRYFLVALRVHVGQSPGGRYLFQTRRHGPFSPRRVQQIVRRYADWAGVKCTPHTLRHQFVTWLTLHSGMSDAELQFLTGHAKRETLAVYQHVALSPEIRGKYEAAMHQAGL